jgi:uncharacterized protein YdiU (UPF0061 family)
VPSSREKRWHREHMEKLGDIHTQLQANNLLFKRFIEAMAQSELDMKLWLESLADPRSARQKVLEQSQGQEERMKEMLKRTKGPDDV